jgi:hypothetical protein
MAGKGTGPTDGGQPGIWPGRAPALQMVVDKGRGGHRPYRWWSLTAREFRLRHDYNGQAPAFAGGG